MPVGVSAYVALANLTIGSTSATVTFSSISQIYKDLVLIVTGRNASSTSNAALRFNNNTGSYYVVTMESNGVGTNSTANADTNMPAGLNWSALTTSQDMVAKFDIFDYSATDKQKSVLMRNNNGSEVVALTIGRWPITSAIDTITVRTGNGTSYASGSTFALYGVSA